MPRNDPTLMFTNAGMVQFKNVFTGAEKRDYSRAVTAQKCVRAGGKHNDLENVGYTARHHTFFEMLGNFSFGDYFKEHAIELAWNLVTRELGLPKDGCWSPSMPRTTTPSISGTRSQDCRSSKIIRIATSDNFWAMGDTGPCGPCSEIFYDHGDKIPGGPPGSPDADGDRFIEIWNLVFMQFEQVTKEKRVALPRPSIDTGMGLERLAAVLQGKHDNYDIDLMRALILASAEATGTHPDGPEAVSHRVIADHLRASSFLVADGVLPSNEGRGYVLRRIMRRAMRHAQRLGAKDPLMWRLVPALVAEMGSAYPELIRAEAIIKETLRLEETRFRQTLERGLKLLDEELARLGSGQELSGEVAFKLYDTYGFPLDLTQDILRGQGRKLDSAGFDAAMARQRAAARKAWAGSGEAATEQVWFDLREKIGATDFLGYATEVAEGQVLGIVRDGKSVDHAEAGRCDRPHRQPDSLLWGVRRPDGRQRQLHRRPWARDRHRRHPEEARRHVRALRPGPDGQARLRRCGGDAGRRRAPRHGCAPITRPPICCMRRCAGGSAPTSPRRARWWRPTACASTTASRCRPRARISPWWPRTSIGASAAMPRSRPG